MCSPTVYLSQIHIIFTLNWLKVKYNMKYFLVPQLTFDTDLLFAEMQTIENWGQYGMGRFTLGVAPITLEMKKHIGSKFKNPRSILYKIEANYVGPAGMIAPHTDHNRACTLNIPVSGDFHNSYVDFYEKNGEGIGLAEGDNKPHEEQIENTSKRYYDAELVEQVNYKVPIVFDTQTVHGVSNWSHQKRYVITVSFRRDMTLEDIYEIYKAGELINDAI